MKLLLIVPALAPIYGGTSNTTQALAAALGRKGWSVDLITTDADGPGALNVSRGCWISQDKHRVRYFSRLGKWEYKLSLGMFIWMLKSVKNYDVVMVNSDFNFPVLAGAMACRWRGVPFLLTPHGMLEPWAMQYKGWKKRVYYFWIERPLVLQGTMTIQALNAAEATNLAALKLKSRIVVLPNGVDPQDAFSVEIDKAAFLDKFPQTQGKTLILFMHRVDPKKGLDLLARAFATVHAKLPHTHVIVAGPDNVNFTGTAKGFFAKAGSGGDEAVTFTGMLEGSLKRGALAAATIFVAPSYSEGFSMSVLEAMATGLPCVITTGCNFPEAGEAQAACVVPIDSGDFAAALIRLIDDPVACKTMGVRARNLVREKYTWDSIAARFEMICRDLLAANQTQTAR